VNGKEINKILNTLPIGSWPYPRILFNVLLERSIGHADEVFWPLMDIACQGPAMIHQPYTRTVVARNHLALELLKSDFTHILMLDIDHVHPINIIQMLARWVLLDHKKYQVVGGLNFRRTPPFDPCAFYARDNGIYAPAEWEKGALLHVDAIGTGSILIAREVFEQLEPPWFFDLYDDVMRDNWPGEDIGFSRKCRDAGIDMWVDTEVTSPHLSNTLITEATFRKYMADTDKEIMDADVMSDKVIP
jgi:hypothetical protein